MLEHFVLEPVDACCLGLEPLLRDVNPTLRYEGLEAMIRIALLVYARADPQEAGLGAVTRMCHIVTND